MKKAVFRESELYCTVYVFQSIGDPVLLLR